MDHQQRMELAMETLTGVAVGDALGEAFSYEHCFVRERTDLSVFKDGSIRYTDDTAMAIGVVECLAMCRGIDEDAQAWIFGRNFRRDPERGYGKMARRLLEQISTGTAWQDVSPSAFGGGSFGNGSAMRVAPLGAYFHDNLAKTVIMASASARVTHFHPEGIAGAIAVAVAAATATQMRAFPVAEVAAAIWKNVLTYTPEGPTANALAIAQKYDPSSPAVEVAQRVGCGYNVSCQDTVPFTIWNACRCLHDFKEAFLSTLEVGGDCDTNAAIVGGIVTSYLGPKAIPKDWLRVTESPTGKFAK